MGVPTYNDQTVEIFAMTCLTKQRVNNAPSKDSFRDVIVSRLKRSPIETSAVSRLVASFSPFPNSTMAATRFRVPDLPGTSAR